MWGMESGGTFNPTVEIVTSAGVPRSFGASITFALAYEIEEGVGSPNPTSDVEFVFAHDINPNGTNGKGGFGTSYKIQLPYGGWATTVGLTYDDSCGFASAPGPASRIADSQGNTWLEKGTIVSGGSATIGFVVCQNGNFSSDPKAIMTIGTLPSAPGAGANSLSMTIFGAVKVREIGTAQTGSGNNATSAPTTLNNVLTSAVQAVYAKEALYGYSQEDRQTVTAVTASAGTPINLMVDANAYFSFDGDHDCGHWIQYVDAAQSLPVSINYNIHWEPYEGAPNAPGQWCATALPFRGYPSVPTDTPHQAGKLSPNARGG